ncbi:MAG: hypothetical protein IT182_00220 [Acidobacteria bacterium]|nr:hypothetical protein [Acidobacteriota bacterium]
MRMSSFEVVVRRALGVVALASCVCVAGAVDARAFERRELPVVTITRADGTPLSIPALAQPRGWLLMVVDADAAGSRRLLDALQTWSLGPSASGIVLVLEGSAASVAEAAREWQEKLPGAVIATDVKGEARRALGVKAVPTVLGARGTYVEWRIAGVLNDPELLRQVVVSWLADDRPPA